MFSTVNEPSGEREKLPVAQPSTFACSIVSTKAGKIFYHAGVGLLRHSLQSKQTQRVKITSLNRLSGIINLLHLIRNQYTTHCGAMQESSKLETS